MYIYIYFFFVVYLMMLSVSYCIASKGRMVSELNVYNLETSCKDNERGWFYDIRISKQAHSHQTNGCSLGRQI